ncbi:uncharacterized protein DEA37_0000142 [Paragonimus westermani]|uniref:Ubiquitin-like domain-containing protein n=1 Tax=Paragonimus westermani TaxID=34504 RepID=A0A5J4NI11_9TREM|nr:uncharacterized protein DEA37_0000142 [Paragonimus westermani]
MDKNSANIPVILIRSFKYRTTHYFVLHNISLTSTVAQLFDAIDQSKSVHLEPTSLPLLVIHRSATIPPPFRSYKFDALKLRHQAHGSKSGDLLIEMSSKPIQPSEKTLASIGIQNESEIAVFSLSDYQAQCDNPEFLW